MGTDGLVLQHQASVATVQSMHQCIFRCLWVIPSGAWARIFQYIKLHNMAADALVPHITKPSAAIVLTIQYKQVLIFLVQLQEYKLLVLPRVGVNKPIYSIPLFYQLFKMTETLVTCIISHSYLTGVTAAELWWHLAKYERDSEYLTYNFAK